MMEAGNVSKGLAAFSLGLGIAEIFAGKQFARWLGAQGHTRLIQGFGARELAAGLAILGAPNKPIGVWSRVAGDVLDLGTLGVLLKGGNAKSRWVWGAIGAVAGITVADVLTARALGKTQDDEQRDIAFEPDFDVHTDDGAADADIVFEPDVELASPT